MVSRIPLLMGPPRTRMSDPDAYLVFGAFNDSGLIYLQQFFVAAAALIGTDPTDPKYR